MIYILDGHWVFKRYAKLVDERKLAIILVGIGQGPEKRRFIDYGPRGAFSYSLFLTEELIPNLESYYRINPEKRSLAGISLSAAFAAVMLMDQPLSNTRFEHYLMFDSAFDTDANFLYNFAWFEEYIKQVEGFDWDVHPKLFFSSALQHGNDAETRGYMDLLVKHGYPIENIHFEQFDTTHGQIGEPSFARVLQLYFNY